MRAFLLVAFAFIQLLSSGYSQNNFNNAPNVPTQRPIYIDYLTPHPNRRYARSNHDDFREVFNSELGSVVQEEIHKVAQEAISDKGHSYEDKEHERVRRNIGPMPRPPPPPPPRPFVPPYITDDLRGFNRRWARETHLDEQIEPEVLRERRDLNIPGYKKPTHRDVIIPNWNPNARTQPWQTLGVRRHRRDLQEEQELLNVEELDGELSEFEDHSRVARGLNQNFGDRGVLINRPRVPHPDSVPKWRNRRDLQIPGYKKPTHRDIIIPNWNPNVRTQPWQHIGVRH